MGKTSRIQIARRDIFRHFEQLPCRVLQLADVEAALSEQRDFWRLTQRTSTADFVKFLTTSGKLVKIVFPFPYPYKKRTVYAWGEVPMFEIMLGIRPDCYFSHYTAVRIHGLTEQVPKTTYINDEQRLESWLSGKLSQRTIDGAFKRPVRVTSQIAETKDFRVVLLSGKNTGKYGVVENDVTSPDGGRFGKVRFTNLERTLVDITVRPVYSGGIPEVLKAFELAREKLSVNRLAGMLERLAYIYPYHQAIGFYLERAGYKSSTLDVFREIPREFDFYLAHDMKQTEYIKAWRLYVPKGL